jgi:hypothetical protein
MSQSSRSFRSLKHIIIIMSSHYQRMFDTATFVDTYLCTHFIKRHFPNSPSCDTYNSFVLILYFYIAAHIFVSITQVLFRHSLLTAICTVSIYCYLFYSFLVHTQQNPHDYYYFTYNNINNNDDL